MSFGFGFGFTKNYVAALFLPAQLFTGTTQGVWYDPSDTTTLFQDAAGTVPVTAVEQPVGLMLDKSKGLVLGPELVINGGFDADTNWTKNGWVISDGVASSSVTAAITQTSPVTLAVGDLVKVTVTVSSLAAGYVYAWVAGSVDAARRTNSVGTFTWYFNITSVTNQEVGIYTANSPAGITIDNVSIQRLPGNHAFNSSGNSANFPVLSARVNLLTKTEDISTADWSKSGTSAPNADTLLELATSGVHRVTQSKIVPATKCCLYAEFYPAGRSSCSLSLYDASGGTTRAGAIFSIDGAGSIISGASALNKISLLPDGWYGCYIESASAFSGGNAVANIGATNGAAESYTGDATKGVRVRKVDFRPIGTGVNLPAYQRVNTATDYDTVGFPKYLKFNGVNQWLQTNSIDFSYTDKMFVSAGVRKLSDSAAGMLLELSTNQNSANNAFYISAPESGTSYGVRVGGNIGYNHHTFAAPISNVFSGAWDNRGATVTVGVVDRFNGVLNTVGQLGTTMAQVNFGNYPLYIGARAGTSLFFNGNLHQLVIAGKPASDAEITATETFINQKTGAY